MSAGPFQASFSSDSISFFPEWLPSADWFQSTSFFLSSNLHFLDLFSGPANHDFCERNFRFSPFIAEFWNTISCALIIHAGVYSLFHFLQIRRQVAERLKGLGGEHNIPLFLCLPAILQVVIGIGSGLFHGALLRGAQISDEVPMVWAALIFHFSFRSAAGFTGVKLVNPVKLFKLAINRQPLEWTDATSFLFNGFAIPDNILFGFLLIVSTFIYFKYDFEVFVVIYIVFVVWGMLGVGLHLLYLSPVQVSRRPMTGGGALRNFQAYNVLVRIGKQGILGYVGGFLFLWLPTEVLLCADRIDRAGESIFSSMLGQEKSPLWFYYDLWTQIAHALFHYLSAVAPFAFTQLILGIWLFRNKIPIEARRNNFLLFADVLDLKETK